MASNALKQRVPKLLLFAEGMSKEAAKLGIPWNKGVVVLKSDANGLVAVEKPSGLLSHPNRNGEVGKALIVSKYNDVEQAYEISDTDSGEKRLVYLLNRLDSATSGVVLLSTSRNTAASVLRAFEQKQVKKTYVALVFGMPRSGPPVWKDRLSVKKAEGGLRAQAGSSGLSAETKLVKVEPIPGTPMVSRLTLMPLTGRTHQLRIQTSKRRIPIVGDRTYGDFQKNKLVAKGKGLKRLCLHCVETELEYQVEGRRFRFKARSKSPF